MLKNTRIGKQFRNIAKILGVSIAVYLALTIKVWFTWETDEVSQFDYLETETQYEEMANIEETENHWPSSAFSKLCSNYKKICNKISRAWTFTDKDKATKFAYVAYLLKKLDTNITRWKNPSEALLAMLINEKIFS